MWTYIYICMHIYMYIYIGGKTEITREKKKEIAGSSGFCTKTTATGTLCFLLFLRSRSRGVVHVVSRAVRQAL